MIEKDNIDVVIKIIGLDKTVINSTIDQKISCKIKSFSIKELWFLISKKLSKHLLDIFSKIRGLKSWFKLYLNIL